MAFPQGDTAEELRARRRPRSQPRAIASSTSRSVASTATTRRVVGAVRDAIGPDPLLRVDPNEALGRARPRSTRSGDSRRSTSTGSSSPLRPATSPASRESGTRSRRRSPPTRRCTRPPSSAPCSNRRPQTRSCSAATSRAASGAGGRWRTSAESYGIPMNRHACPESAISTFAAPAGDGLPAEPDARQPGDAPPAHASS